jgi:tetratricopeptide (TPR) repeat protein
VVALRAAVAGAVVAWLSTVALADDPPSPPAGEPAVPVDPAAVPVDPVIEEPPAVKAFDEGRKLLEEGKPGEACAKFEQSIELDPDAPGTLLNLGLCNQRLGRTATALGWFRKAQFRAAETKKTEYEEAAVKETVLLAELVPKIHFDLANPPPPGATFLLDGKQVIEADLSNLEVDPQSHTLEMRVAGKPPLRVEFTAKISERKTVLVPIMKTEKQIIVVDHGAPQKALAYLLAGTGVSLYIASAATSLIAKHELDISEHPEDRQHWQNIARFGGTSLFVLGTAAIVTAAVVYVRAPGAERIERTVIAPTAGEHDVGVAVVGSF